MKEDGTAHGFQPISQHFMDRVLKETKVKERSAERDIQAKVGSDAETLARAQQLLGHADSRVTRAPYRRRAEVIE